MDQSLFIKDQTEKVLEELAYIPLSNEDAIVIRVTQTDRYAVRSYLAYQQGRSYLLRKEEDSTPSARYFGITVDLYHGREKNQTLYKLERVSKIMTPVDAWVGDLMFSASTVVTDYIDQIIAALDEIKQKFVELNARTS